jgi:outer membrane putative beta-barrel porin/alpha-amylase
VAIPFVWTDVTARVTLPGGGTVKRSDSVSGLGDIEFWPLALSWAR